LEPGTIRKVLRPVVRWLLWRRRIHINKSTITERGRLTPVGSSELLSDRLGPEELDCTGIPTGTRRFKT
jgi:hypothetical protein